MDPNATLQHISFALIEGNEPEARDGCYDLCVWLANKEFEPDWARYPEGTRFYRQYACELTEKVERY